MLKPFLLILILIVSPSRAIGAPCEEPTYVGVNRSATLHFLSSDQGYIDLRNKDRRKIITFETNFSNCFAREFITLSTPKNVGSVLMRLNRDFTPAVKNPAPFLITPDLGSSFYYGTMADPIFHQFVPDDTLKFDGCGNRSK